MYNREMKEIRNKYGVVLKKSFVILNITIPMVMGAAFYMFYCPNTIFVTYLRDEVGIHFKVMHHLTNNILFIIIRCWVLDMMWAYSLAAFLVSIIKNKKTAMLISSGFAILSELLQYLGVFKGTFDFIDIICELVAINMAAYLVGGLINKKND